MSKLLVEKRTLEKYPEREVEALMDAQVHENLTKFIDIESSPHMEYLLKATDMEALTYMLHQLRQVQETLVNDVMKSKVTE